MKQTINEMKQDILNLKIKLNYLQNAYDMSKNSYVSLYTVLTNMKDMNYPIRNEDYDKLCNLDKQVVKTHIDKTEVEKLIFKLEKRLYHRFYYEKYKEKRKEKLQKKREENKINK